MRIAREGFGKYVAVGALVVGLAAWPLWIPPLWSVVLLRPVILGVLLWAILLPPTGRPWVTAPPRSKMSRRRDEDRP